MWSGEGYDCPQGIHTVLKLTLFAVDPMLIIACAVPQMRTPDGQGAEEHTGMPLRQRLQLQILSESRTQRWVCWDGKPSVSTRWGGI